MEYKVTNNLLCIKSVKAEMPITDTFMINKIEHMCFSENENRLTINTNKNYYSVTCDKEKYAQLIGELDDSLSNQRVK